MVIFKKLLISTPFDLYHPLNSCNEPLFQCYNVSFQVYVAIVCVMLVTDGTLYALRKRTNNFDIIAVFNPSFWLYMTTVVWALTICWDSLNKTLLWLNI